MTASADPPHEAVPNKPRAKYGMGDVIRALGLTRVRAMLMLGFASGAPFMLTANTLGFWLRDKGLTLGAISALSWVGLVYSLKFLWAPMVDRIDAPLLGRLGRRRGWILAAQLAAAGGLLAMAAIGPGPAILPFALAALTVAFASASQDIVIDAWRIEASETAEELGLMTAAYQVGYRVALLATVSWILILADYIGWAGSYVVAAAAMAIGVWGVVLAHEPARAEAVLHQKSDRAALWTPRGFFDAVAGPFVEFFRAHRVFGLVMLLTITLYHLSDYLRGPVINPFYHDVGYSKVQVGLIRGLVGLWGSLAGIGVAGFLSLRIGFFKTLIIGAVLQPLGIGAFAWVALAGGPNLPLLAAVNALDDFAIGFAGVALVAYMSSLTNLGYTASQYAVMSSALAWSGKTLKGFSGFVVQGLQHGRDLMHAYALFFMGVAALGVPAIILCFVLKHAADRQAAARPTAAA